MARTNEAGPANAPHPPRIISASRRTDIPQFYGRWFAERRRAGETLFRTAFGTSGRASLRREDVLAYLFWTKYAAPFEAVLDELSSDGTPFAFQYTVNGYGAAFERAIPPLSAVLDDVRAVRARLPDAACLEWRYDPVILCDERPASWHVGHFAALVREMAGLTRVVNVSVVEPYVKTVRRMGSTDGVLYRSGAAPRRGAGEARAAGERAAELLRELSDLAAQAGIELRVCSNPEWGLLPSQCISPELFLPWGSATDAVREIPSRPSRPGCRCLAVTDIGMDNTCIGGCRYCYVTVSDEVASRNHSRHDPLAPSLR